MSGWNADSIPWERLERLRDVFLGAASAARRDYWRDQADLLVYDAFFGKRILWKWEAALQMATARGAVPGRGARVLDWGCGTGVAARAFVQAHETARIYFHDRSPLAVDFAKRSLAASLGGDGRSPALEILKDSGGADVDVLLFSHVLGEADAALVETLFERARRTPWIFWVDAGSAAISRRLSEFRNRLTATHRVYAPCTHQAQCPVLLAGKERDWCHFFGDVPAEVFQDRAWSLFSRRLGIDLRALPFAFLVLGPKGHESAPSPTARILGRPSFRKTGVVVDLCSERGLERRSIERRTEPELLRRLKAARPGDLPLIE